MAGGIVNIILRSISQGSGFKDNIDNAQKLKREMGDLSQAAQKFGTAFGTAGGIVGSAISNILKGGIWGAMAEGVRLVVHLLGKWRDSAKEAAEAEAKAFKESHDARMKNLADFASAAEKASAAQAAAISERTKRLNAEIDATKELIKATLELEKANARQRGDASAVAALEKEIESVDADAAAEKLVGAMDEAVSRRLKAKDDYRIALLGSDRAKAAARYESAVLADRISEVRAEASEKAQGQAVSFGPGAVGYLPATDEERKAAADAAEATFRQSEEYKKMAGTIDETNKKVAEFKERMAAAKKEIAAIKEEENNLNMRADAMLARDEAKRKNAEQDAVDAETAAAKKTAEERQKAEIAAAQAAAKERERLDREAHQKRMADLRAEIAEQTRTAGSLKAVAASAQSEFDKAFAMYRDPSRAEAEIGAEKAYRADLDRLHKDARRYGGKWRIDELSSLMAAGDTQGVSDTLASWRKSKGFTPQVEALVRASAAEKTKTTAEVELRKIEGNVSRMDATLKELADAQSGKLGEIAASTSGLAAKMDALLRVKG